MVYIFSFAIGIGPIFSLMDSEIFPTQLRGVGTSISTMFNWSTALLVSITFLSLANLAGKPVTFYIYAACAIAAIAFCWFLVLGTKGKSLEQIEHYWKNGRHWRKGR
ncbi:MAG: MFS transporter [Chloroflexota bacterium]|nr:MFS transporter [Chloroflexota bacterium]